MQAAVSKKNPLIISIIALVALLLQLIVSQQSAGVVEAAGSTYYVALTGNDSNPGTLDRPWKTVQKGTRSLHPGDTVLIRGGVYAIGSNDDAIELPSGTPDRYVTLQAYPGESVTIQGNYPTLGDGNWNGINVKGQSYIQIKGLTVRRFHSALSCRAPGHHIVVQANTFEYNSESGIASEGAVSGSLRGCEYMTIIGNRIHDNGYYDNGKPATGPYEGWSSGITMHPDGQPFAADNDYSKFHSIISGNVIYHNYDGTGADSGEAPDNVNEPDHTDGNGIIVDRGANFPPILIENNVVFDNGGRCIEPLDSENVWIIGNTCYGNGTDTLMAKEARAEIGAGVMRKNVHILNNIAYGVGDVQLTYFPGASAADVDMRNNVWFGQPYRETDSLYGVNYVRANPLFIHASADPNSADFHLQPNSPAINIGVNVPGLQFVDFDNKPRPQARPLGSGYDSGAYEYTGTIVAPTPVPASAPMAKRVFVPFIAKK
jgi:parallel beta-helix repeat protein